MEYIEVTGKSVEEAITNACTKLGIPSDKLDYEVIDKGNSGFLGIFNSKPAKIKAREKQEEPEVKSVETPKKSEEPVHVEKKFEKKTDDLKKAEPKKEFKSEPKKESSKRNTSLLIITRMQKLRKLLRLKHSQRKSLLQKNRRKLSEKISKHFLTACLVL